MAPDAGEPDKKHKVVTDPAASSSTDQLKLSSYRLLLGREIIKPNIHMCYYTATTGIMQMLFIRINKKLANSKLSILHILSII